MSGPPDREPPVPAGALEQLGRIALRETSMEQVLQKVADVSRQVMPGNPETSVSLLVGGRPSTVVSSGELAMDCDESQYGHGDGPCLHAARTGELTEVADARADPRWPDYLRYAVERGCLSSMSFPLPVSEGVVGALNVYARAAGAFDDESRAIGTRLAPYAGVAAANAHAYEEARGLAGNLQAALESRATIDQAKGILMERFAVTADVAFQVLVRVSMRSNRKVREIADRLVRTGEIDLA